MRIAILKTGALGDVLRTTSILPGLRARYPEARVTWYTAASALALLEHHPLVDELVGVDPGDEQALLALARERQAAFERVLSLDDEWEMCRFASALAPGATTASSVLSGAFVDAAGERAYTDDVGPWFDMGLLSRLGKEEADRRKLRNREGHAAIYARMLGIEAAEPSLHLPSQDLARGAALVTPRAAGGPCIGLNTGAGGRWESKRLPVERVVALAAALEEHFGERLTLFLLGGRDERERNARIVEAMAASGTSARLVDLGVDHDLTTFAGIIDALDLLVTSDSLALHVAVARRTPLVAFFAPTSPAEIDLYGRGEKVVSTSPDAGSYRSDADTSTLTAERLAEACLRVLGESPASA